MIEAEFTSKMDNNLGYCPDNCCWGTLKTQARNKTNNRIVTVRGKTACLAELCELFKVPYKITEARLRLGWNPERAFFEPARHWPSGR